MKPYEDFPALTEKAKPVLANITKGIESNFPSRHMPPNY
jgi:hypothetical protein